MGYVSESWDGQVQNQHMSNIGKEGQPLNLSETKAGPPALSDRKRRHIKISDYLLPVCIERFRTPIFPPRNSDQPRVVREVVLPYVNWKNINGRQDIAQYTILDHSEVVLVRDKADNLRLAVQRPSRTAIAREYIPEDKQAEALQVIQSKRPKAFYELATNPYRDQYDIPVYTKYSDPNDRWVDAWSLVGEMATYNEAFDFLSHFMNEAPGGRIRIEMHQHHTIPTERGADGVMRDKDKLASNIFECSPIVVNGEQAIAVRARGYFFTFLTEDFEPEDAIDTQFLVFQDRLEVPDEEVEKIIDRIHSEKPRVAEWLGHFNEQYGVVSEIKKHWWNQIIHPLLHNQGEEWDYKNGQLTKRFRKPRQYAIQGLGQEIMRSGYGTGDLSMRILDAAYDKPTVRSESEVDAKIYLTQQEVDEEDRREREYQQRWLTDILPRSREWPVEQSEAAGEYIHSNMLDPIKLAREKFINGTRLIVVGTTIHPLRDDLMFRMMQELPVDFIAVEARKPDDRTRALKEQQLFSEVHLKNGGIIEMNPEDAKARFPEEYKDPTKPPHTADSLIARARLQGIDTVLAITGDSYRDMNRGITTEIATYMRNHPDLKGIYIASLLHSLAWPGYRNKKEGQKVGFQRPFIDVYSVANAHLSEPKTSMPAYELKKEFPGEVYTLAQFAMPTGFGGEWRNLRSSIEASGISERFALDSITDSPFATQWYLFDVFHAQEAGIPDDELYKHVIPINVEWGRLLDGVLVYPSLT